MSEAHSRITYLFVLPIWGWTTTTTIATEDKSVVLLTFIFREINLIITMEMDEWADGSGRGLL